MVDQSFTSKKEREIEEDEAFYGNVDEVPSVKKFSSAPF